MLLDKAKAIGDTNEVERLTIDLAKAARCRQAGRELCLCRSSSRRRKIIALERCVTYEKVDAGEQESLALAQESAVAKRVKPRRRKALADKLANEAHSVDLLTTSEKARVEQIGQVVDVLHRAW